MGSDSTASEIPKGLRASKQTFDLTSFSFLLPDRCSTSPIVRIWRTHLAFGRLQTSNCDLSLLVYFKVFT